MAMKALLHFGSIMNMPCLTKTAYYKQVDNIVETLEDEAKEEMRKAAVDASTIRAGDVNGFGIYAGPLSFSMGGLSSNLQNKKFYNTILISKYEATTELEICGFPSFNNWEG